MKYLYTFTLCILVSVSSCNNDASKQKTSNIKKNHENKTQRQAPKKPIQPLTSQFKNYWYAGKAEISSYQIEQYRYGQKRQGSAVLIYVTEPFLPNEQVKANQNNPENVPVLKLNTTKNFITGIYPYSIMQSVFFPVSNNSNALKVTASIQEWCGQTYTQINNKERFNILLHSYFEGEADKDFSLDQSNLENELWTQVRVNPKSLPTGNFKVIPSLEYLNLNHIPINSYNAFAELSQTSYKISYPDLNRTLTLYFSESFPHIIDSWEERIGETKNTGKLTTTINSKYWNKNTNEDQPLRALLQLK